MADAHSVREMWAKVSSDREIVDPRAPGGHTAAGIAQPQQAAAAPPPHASGEGTSSSGSGATSAPTPAVGPPHPAKSGVSDGKQPSKKARHTHPAAPAVGRKVGLDEPAEPVYTEGKCPANEQRVLAWRTYLDALVIDNLVMAPADADEYMATLRAGLDQGSAMLEAQRIEEERLHNWVLAYLEAYPMQRPDNGCNPPRARWAPFVPKPVTPTTADTAATVVATDQQ